MANREQVDEIMDLLRNAIRNKHHKSNGMRGVFYKKERIQEKV